MRILALLLALLSGCSGCASIPSHSQLRETALRLESFGGGVCGATATGPAELVTAAHCIDTPLVAIDGASADVLKVERIGSDVARVTLKAARFQHWAKTGPRPLEGSRVRWWGQAAGLETVYREGYVARGWTTETLVDANGFFGDSGSGLFSEDGRLVAVMSAIKAWQRNGIVFSVMVVVPVQ